MNFCFFDWLPRLHRICVLPDKQLAKYYRKLKEVWLHRDCALWNSLIQMDPNTGDLTHVSDACSTYLEIVSLSWCVRRSGPEWWLSRRVPSVKYLVQHLRAAIEIVKFATIIRVQKQHVWSEALRNLEVEYFSPSQLSINCGKLLSLLSQAQSSRATVTHCWHFFSTMTLVRFLHRFSTIDRRRWNKLQQ